MRYPQCNNLCDPEHDVHYLGRIIKGAVLRDSAKDLDEFMFNPGRVCQCGARSMPHIGMAYPCPLTNSGSHFKEII